MDKRMKLVQIIGWIRINSVFFISAFLVTGLFCLIFPLQTLSLFGKWAALLSSLGAKSAGQFASSSEMFTHVLQRNCLAAAIFFIVGYLLQAPLALIFSGAFYAFVVFLAPYTIGKTFSSNDWILIFSEILALIIASSLSSAFAGFLNQVEPSIKDWWKYSKKSWRSLSMKSLHNWKDHLPSWLSIILGGFVVIFGILLFVAWFEVYGY